MQRIVGRQEFHFTMGRLKTHNLIVRSRHLGLSLAYYPPSGIQGIRNWRLLTLGLAHQRQRSTWTSRYAQSTTYATVSVQRDPVKLFIESLHLAPFQTGPATLAYFRLNLGYKRARDNLAWLGVRLEPSQNATATATTTADETDIP